MKALRWHAKGNISVDDIPIPQPSDAEILIYVMYSGIYGSGLHEYLVGPLFIPMEPHPLTGEKCRLAGMDDYLTKPIDEKSLFQVLRKWIQVNSK